MMTTRSAGVALAGLALTFALTACSAAESQTAEPSTTSGAAATTTPAAAPSRTSSSTSKPAAPAVSTTVIFGETITSPMPGAPGSGTAAAGGDCSGFEGIRAEADQGGAPLWCTKTDKGTVWLAAQTPSNTHQPSVTQGCGNAGDRERDVHTGKQLVCKTAPQYGGALTWLTV